MKPVTIIAEAGVNHNGDKKLALELIDAAADAGADYVKFQTFSAAELVSETLEMADYQKEQMEQQQSQFEMLLNLQLDQDDHFELVEYCDKRGVKFLSTPFDLPSLAFLTDGLNLPLLKVGSGDLTNAPLLFAAAKSGRSIVLSSGMSSLGDIELSLGLLALGYSKSPPDAPTRTDMIDAWFDPSMRQLLQGKVQLLHCVSNYPASNGSANLAVLETLQRAFKLPVGYSDHTLGGTACIAAVALGASCIEKHLTLDVSMSGPDHASSSEPEELKQIVKSIRDTEVMIGESIKFRTAEENNTSNVAKKTLVARSEIKQGEQFSEENLTTKRAQGELDPMTYWEYVGRTALRNFAAGESIDV